MVNQPLLTIGMAHFEDFSGLWPTIQSIRLNNQRLMPFTHFVVVNNSPEDRATASALMGVLGVHDDKNEPADKKLDYTRGVDGRLDDGPVTTYVEMPGNKGTSLSREQIFKHAKGKYTAAMDCHLEFWPGAFDALMNHYQSDPESGDILTGPLLLDSLRGVQTHFRDVWDDGMWGQWSAAWQCGCSEHGSKFDLELVKLESGTQMAMPRELRLGNVPISECTACHKPIPDFTWEGHEAKYVQRGFRQLGYWDNGPAFEIPGQGLGFFSCRTAVWPGFNPDALGFGGEELYIHEKFRQRGGKALCIPNAKWVHRFYRQGGAKYPNTDFWKCRNYVLEFNELGLSLDPVKKHFVDTPARRFNPPRPFLTPGVWEILIADPINTKADPSQRLQALRDAATKFPELTTPEAVFDRVSSVPRDLDQHMPTLRALTQLAGGVAVELTARKESTVALLAGRPAKVISFTSEAEEYCWKTAALVKDTTVFDPRGYQHPQIFTDLPENDLLFIDTLHTYPQLLTELQHYAPRSRRFIIVHDTEIFGDRGEGGSLGLKAAIAEYCENNPQWAVIDHTAAQYGLTVLSCNPEDRPETPIQGFNVPFGPGTELKKILSSLGINPGPNCNCNKKAIQMDVWGVEGCEVPENFQTIIGWLKEGTWSGLDLAGAVARSFFTGIAWELNPLSPFDSLVRLCIKRAVEAEKKRVAAQFDKLTAEMKGAA